MDCSVLLRGMIEFESGGFGSVRIFLRTKIFMVVVG